MEKLAINGGLPIRESKIPISRPDFGEEEIKAASEVIKSGLVEGNGPKTEEFEKKTNIKCHLALRIKDQVFEKNISTCFFYLVYLHLLTSFLILG